MANYKKIILAVTLLLFSIFINFGYASLTKELNVNGEIQAVKPPEKVYFYISDVTRENNSNATDISHSFFSPTILKTTFTASRNGGSITYKVTITNESNVTYWFDKIKYLTDDESNNLIGNGISIVLKDKASDTSETFDNNDWIPPKTVREFYVTFTFGNNAVNKGELTTSINLQFEERMDAVFDEVTAMLNNSDAYDDISEVFNAAYKEDGQKVIGNIGDDSKIFDDLFGKNITVTVDGVEKPATVLIRRENVDGKDTGDDYDANGGPTGCEYTIYVTTESLTNEGSKVTVYAVTYTQDAYGNWHQLGQLYEGEATVVDYDSTDSKYTGSFDVYSWQATANTYEVADGLSYSVGLANGDQYQIMKNFDDIISVQDQNIFNSIDNTKIFKKVYDIIQENINSDAPEVLALRVAFQSASPYYIIYNNGQEIKVNRNCTRAEIVSYIIDIQKALDYYYQVHTI